MSDKNESQTFAERLLTILGENRKREAIYAACGIAFIGLALFLLYWFMGINIVAKIAQFVS